jgi:hypothetical protein
VWRWLLACAKTACQRVGTQAVSSALSIGQFNPSRQIDSPHCQNGHDSPTHATHQQHIDDSIDNSIDNSINDSWDLGVLEHDWLLYA